MTFTNSSALARATVQPPLHEIKRYGRRLVIEAPSSPVDTSQWADDDVVSVEPDLLVSIHTRRKAWDPQEEGAVLQALDFDVNAQNLDFDVHAQNLDSPQVASLMAVLHDQESTAALDDADTTTNADDALTTPAPSLWQWNLMDSEPYSVHAEAMWRQSLGSSELVVAVLDTGLASIAKNLFLHLLGGYDFISDEDIALDGDGKDADPTDPGDSGPSCPQASWHGTQIMSLLAARHDNAWNFKGIAPNSTLLPIRVLGQCSQGYANDVTDAIVWAAGGLINGLPSNLRPARIISMSFAGHGQCPSYLQSAINQASGLGSILLAAAGNDGLPSIANSFPANCQNVISVGASTRAGKIAAYSNRNATVLAPGGDSVDPILVLSVGENQSLSVDSATGTSIAVPHVAGFYALHNYSWIQSTQNLNALMASLADALTVHAQSACMPGFYSATGSDPCVVCPMGSYCPTTAAAVPCPANSFCPIGLTAAIPCPTNTYSLAAAKTCLNNAEYAALPEFALVMQKTGHRIAKVLLDGSAGTQFAGSTKGFLNAVGTSAKFGNPNSVNIAPDGSFALVADFDNRLIRKIDMNTIEVTTLVGTQGITGSVDGVGTNAQFNSPGDVVIGPGNSVAYVADTINCLVRKIDISTKTVSTIAGQATVCTSFVPGPYGTNQLTKPSSVLPYGGSVLVTGEFCRVALIDSGLTMSVLAGSGACGSSTDGIGTSASFNLPKQMAMHPTGGFLVLIDTGGIRKLNMATNEVSTLLVNAYCTGIAMSSDGTYAVVSVLTPASILRFFFSDNTFVTLTTTFVSSATYLSILRSSMLTVACSNGTYAAASKTACLGCSPGTASLSGETPCTTCVSGQYCLAASISTNNNTCAAGSFCATPSTMATCPTGQYCIAGVTAGTPCDAGTYSAAAGMSACVPCSVGQYCPSGSTAAVVCTKSNYCPNTSTLILCPAGYYCPANATAPTLCPAGSYCSEGSDKTGTCASGYYCPAGVTSYALCAAGSYCSSTTSSTPCASGQYCPAGSTMSLTCAAGSVCMDTTSEVPCSAGQYCPAGSTSMVSCAAGSYCPNTTSVLTCSSGQYCPAGSTTANLCAAGSICVNTTSQVPCSAGQYCPAGSTKSTACALGSVCTNSSSQVACSLGQYCPSGSTTSATCAKGFVCTTPSSQVPCSLGQFCRAGSSVTTCPPSYTCPTTTSVVPVQKCLAGSKFSGSLIPNLTIASEPSPPCPSGYYESSGVCVMCPANTYSTTIGATSVFSCGQCPLFTSSIAGWQFCSPNTGYAFSTNYNETAYSFIGIEWSNPTCYGMVRYTANGASRWTYTNGQFACSRNVFADPAPGYTKSCYCYPHPKLVILSSVCTLCVAGQYATVPGLSECTLCTAGTYSVGVGMTSSSVCIECSASSYCVAGSISSAPCPAGSYCPNTSSVLPCSSGQYCPAGSTAASSCPAGTFRAGTEGVSQADCSPCSLGTFGGFAEGSTAECPLCTSGRYCPDPTTQAACPANTNSSMGSASQLGCRCFAGYVCSYKKLLLVVVTLNSTTIDDFNNNVNGVRTTFIANVAASAGVSPQQVTIVNVQVHSGRRLLEQLINVHAHIQGAMRLIPHAMSRRGMMFESIEWSMAHTVRASLMLP